MKTMSLSEAKDKFSSLVDKAESLRETLLWLSKPGIADSVAAAEREYASEHTVTGDDLRAQFGLPAK